jgi:dipeptidyl-peptidase-4
MLRNNRSGFIASAAVFALSCGIAAQQPRQYTTEDYAAAERFMSYNVNPLAYKCAVKAQSLDDGRFLYRVVVENGIRYILIDPAKGTRGSRQAWRRASRRFKLHQGRPRAFAAERPRLLSE